MNRLTYRHTVKGFHNDVQLAWCERSRSWLLQVLVNRVPVASIVAGREPGIEFVAPEPDTAYKRHHIQVRGAFIDMPVESWRELKQWHDDIAKAVAPVQVFDDVPRDLPPICPPLAPFAQRARQGRVQEIRTHG
ncbi:hypothetical protein KIP31_09920 [Xanthomonas campestris pv. campestris]|uniref:hypothetical protein n=1 Tax=Xanthomonas campestris TaxID=339 RepID=UPI000E31C293|nr:hypothetical protein [Xanthomonas campestris]MCF8799215.1 hypothetical protein [Xanthomonas campestris pv. campestris]MCF8809634.1 hypothetical protein [Xanthomonas campestris pv. campestris]MCF8812157.1 hypothetical protein [Xanthomonas campestris pv. campestris]MDM7674556.1 hypothetical protein [Xanthomonas campestris pv. campestris]MEA9569604.1 hypothetical protein [Xanthomonas campestris]